MKLIIVGSGGVGKTAYVKRIRTGRFEKKYIPTLGVEVHPIKMKSRDVTFDAWDCAGNPKYLGLGSGYYVNAHCAIVMYDIMSKESFVEAQKYVASIRRIMGKIPIALCGNKSDLPDTLRDRDNYDDEKRVKSQVVERDYISKNKGIKLFEISSKTGHGINDVLEWLIDSQN